MRKSVIRIRPVGVVRLWAAAGGRLESWIERRGEVMALSDILSECEEKLKEARKEYAGLYDAKIWAEVAKLVHRMKRLRAQSGLDGVPGFPDPKCSTDEYLRGYHDGYDRGCYADGYSLGYQECFENCWHRENQRESAGVSV